MKFEVSVSKLHMFLIVGVVLVFAVSVGVFAFTSSPGAVPNPGHALSSIQGYFSGDADLQNSLGRFCQSDGTNCQSGGGSGGKITCSSTPFYDSVSSGGVSAKPGRVAVNVPSVCIGGSGNGCVLKQEILVSSGSLAVIDAVRFVDYYQDSLTGAAWASSSDGESGFTNGDSNVVDIFPLYGTASIQFRDDSTVESDRLKFSAYDDSSTLGQKIYVCS